MICKSDSKSPCSLSPKKLQKNKFKFGIKVPEGINHAYQLDKASAPTPLKDAIKRNLAEINKYNIIKPLSWGS